MGKPAFDPNQKFDVVASNDKPAFDPTQEFKPVSVDPMSAGKAAAISGESGALLGLRPVVAGTAAAAGDLSGQIGNVPNRTSNEGLGSFLGRLISGSGGKGININQAVDAFKQGRTDANAEQTQASKDHPNISLASDIGGSLLTLPFLPAKDLAGAVKLGAGLGAAHAAGSADTLKEAAVDIGGGAALGGVGYGAIKGIGAAGGALADTQIGQKIGQKAKNLLIKVPSELTGISDKEIESYSTRADKVKKIYADAGGDPSLAAQHAKENIVNDVTRTRRELNNQISSALENSSPEPVIDAAPILKELEAAKARIHPIYGENDIGAVDDIIQKVKQASTHGKLSVKDLQDTKNFLYDSAKGSYNQGGQIFPVGKEVAKAAKGAGSIAKKIIDDVGPSEIKNANRQLQQLHEIEDHMGNNLLNPNAKSHSDIYAVGGGAQNNNSQSLQQLGDMTGQNYLQDATDLAASRTFGKAPLLPAIKTGRALIGPVIGGSIGGAAGGVFGGAPGAYLGAKVGAGIGTVLSSPAALKLAIDTGRLSSKVVSYLSRSTGISPGNVGQLYQYLQNPQAQEILMKAILDDNNSKAAQNQMNGVGAAQRMAQKIN